jgi:hypothetical protein
MKTSFFIIALFLGFNGLGQDSIRVFVNGKVGLNHADGRLILEPIYTDFKIEAPGIRLFDNDLEGYLPKGSEQEIPANYKSISPNNVYFEAQKEGGAIDLYFGSELIATDLDTRIQSTDILLEMDLVIIRRDEKAGIINQKGTIIVPLEYPSIEQVPSFTYILNDSILFNYILVLDKSEYFYSPESEGFLRYGESVLYLAKGDGTLVSDSIFNEVSSDPEMNRISLKHDKKIAFMNDQFQIDYLPYEYMIDFMDWKICSTGEKTVVFNRFGVALDTFDSVILPTKTVYEAFNEEGLVAMSYHDEPIFEGFVYVTKNSGDYQQLAIYDLKNQKVVSRWGKEVTFVGKGTTSSGAIVWVYENGEENLTCKYKSRILCL